MILIVQDDIKSLETIYNLIEDDKVIVDAIYPSIEEAYIGYKLSEFYEELPKEMKKVKFDDSDEDAIVEALMTEDDDIFDMLNIEIENAFYCHIIDKMNS